MVLVKLMGEKIYALDLNNEEWTTWLEKELKQPKFRADQICQWLWQKGTFDAEEMTNLSLPLREQLAQRINFALPKLIEKQRSEMDGTRKYLWQMRDGNTVESVLLRQNDRMTACVSTQVGCPLQCTFCATGLSGYVRNLSAGEIASQFLAMEKAVGRDINNIVYMGMGEPFLNTDAVLKSIRMLNSPEQRNLGIRHMTISTSGIIPGIIELAESGLGVKLAISLNAADDNLRSTLMPVNHTYPVDELRKTMQEYQKITGNRLTIEYALFGGINDGIEQARELVRFLKGIHVFINLIPYNAVDDRYQKPLPETILKFRNVLTTAGFEAEFRQSQGADIDAACGQLRRKTMTGAPVELEPKPHSVTKTNMATRDEIKKPVRRTTDRAAKREDTKSDSRSSRTVTKGNSGGFVSDRGTKRRKTDKPESDRYRSGKMKEARPAYRGQGEDIDKQREERPSSDRTSYNREDRPSASRSGKPSSYGKTDKPRRFSDKTRDDRNFKSNDRGPRNDEQGSRPDARNERTYNSRDGKPSSYGKTDKPRRFSDKTRDDRSSKSDSNSAKSGGYKAKSGPGTERTYSSRDSNPSESGKTDESRRFSDKPRDSRGAKGGKRGSKSVTKPRNSDSKTKRTAK